MPAAVLLTGALILANACSRPSAPAVPQAPAAPQAAAPSAPPTFVNRVWQVESSSAVAPGTLYTFLSEGTLVVASAGNKPMVGSWSRSGDGLVMVEDSISYPVDIVSLSPASFVIRSHNPGEPVDIAMVPAEGH